MEQLSYAKSSHVFVRECVPEGKSLHSLAKAAADQEIKSKAKSLELAWRPDSFKNLYKKSRIFCFSAFRRQDFKDFKKRKADDLPLR